MGNRNMSLGPGPLPSQLYFCTPRWRLLRPSLGWTDSCDPRQESSRGIGLRRFQGLPYYVLSYNPHHCSALLKQSSIPTHRSQGSPLTCLLTLILLSQPAYFLSPPSTSSIQMRELRPRQPLWSPLHGPGTRQPSELHSHRLPLILPETPIAFHLFSTSLQSLPLRFQFPASIAMGRTLLHSHTKSNHQI